MKSPEDGFRVQVHWLVQSVFAVIALPLSVGVISLLSRPSLNTIAIALALAASVWFLWALARATVEVDSETITVKVPYGWFQMRWLDIRRIVTNGVLFSFQGNAKQLSVSMAMAGKNRQRFYDFVERQATQLGIMVEKSATIPVQHINTRIR